eukprot:TRINITY_DN80048_c0_g1_i1.p1 TRINITY_DN80048_c0_g1~~TRINITY_DN80048_c0_g1_i1.p1  ORF type:complete len:515 (+),score=102.74 TRINITY_DN80048_c0_g1_i1:188-1732(+)
MSRGRDVMADGNRNDALLPAGENFWKTALADGRDLLKLSLPIFITSVSFVAMKATDTALLGHTGKEYLEAVALGDLWTSSTGVFIQSRAVSTFCTQSFGAGEKMAVGIWLQVAYAVLAVVCIAVFTSWCFTGTVLRALGKDEKLVDDAQYFSLVLAVCMPVRIAFSQLSTFFSSQRIMRPGVVCASSGMIFNFLFGFMFVLGFPFPGLKLGFAACPWVTTGCEYMQLFVLWYVFCYKKRLHEECWPGWSSSAVTWERVRMYLGQYIPSALSLGSDFWRVAVIGWIASSLGDINVAVWNASYRICWIVLTFLGAVGGAMTIKLGQALGQGDTRHVRRLIVVSVAAATLVVGVLVLAVAMFPRQIASIFSDDDVVLDLFEEVRFPLAAFVLFMNLSVVLEKIPTSAGYASTGFYAGLVGSWVGQVPCVFLFTKYWRDDLVGLYWGTTAGYALLVVILLVAIMRIDWEDAAEAARQRAEAARSSPTRREGASSLQVSMQEQDSAERNDEERPSSGKQ